ncbi:Putative uncharacterized protein [Taphrina deformans PYCC 5710]|uniref:Rab-GAP TBC domain-containing protein n=1 Tax=Taphrina deformans (strain PYCC 5710 / ATCC 11124 / CBS 356.35 / IMI 108563 / JCM 9778 / NBRC 8474) TaxID=1097556 RepID=R4XJ04_TAPDE|nr:Putative uncharacterized protein [Taphrina deformans PYCC 5710]|eukprot:CCG83355.1 Putative uncharacterized protein [Taphrina deformans PYCC 5710]
MERLAGVLRAYSLYDPAVGYVQGLHMVAATLLLYCKDEEAFSLLVKLMKDYNLRSLYLPDMPGLHIRLYQFDRMVEELLPAVHVHLIRSGVTSSMYASQWFLTLFANKFPIPLVIRIFDVVIMTKDGIDNVLKFGIALMQKNERQILAKTKLEDLLFLLQENLCTVYQNELVKSPGSGIFGSGPEPTYRVDEFVNDALDIDLDASQLKLYETEYLEAANLQRVRKEEQESMKQSNITLQATVRRLEENLAQLNKEHIELANELISSKINLARLEDENEALQGTVADLKNIVDAQPAEVEARLKDEMTSLIEKATTMSVENQRLEDAMSEMEKEHIDLKMKYATEHERHDALVQKMENLKKSFNS